MPPLIAGLGLVDLLKDKDDLVGAEIGVSWAQTSEHLLQNLKIKKYYCIDPWVAYGGANSGAIFPIQEEADRHFKEALVRLEPFENKVVILQMTSKEAVEHVPDSSLDFVFIDANHSKEAVTEDSSLWWPKVKWGGIFAGHDWSCFDVKPVIQKFFKEDLTQIKLMCNDMWYVVK